MSQLCISCVRIMQLLMFSAAVTVLKACTLCVAFCWHCWFWEGFLLDSGVAHRASTETWDLCGGRHDGKPSLVWACICICSCVCVLRGRKRERAQRNTHSLWLCGGVRLWRCIIACPLVSSHHKYNRWNWWTVSIDCGHFTSCGIQLCFIMCSRECTILHGNKIKSKAVPVQCETTVG